MGGVHEVPKNTNVISNKIQLVFHGVGKHSHKNDISPKYTIQYSNIIIRCVNEEYSKEEG